MLSHVEFPGFVANHVIDEPWGELQQKLASELPHRLLGIHAIGKDTLKNQLANLIVVQGSWKHLFGAASEGLAAPALCAIFAASNFEVGHLLVDLSADSTDGEFPGPFT
jgi:hypothetical protein